MVQKLNDYSQLEVHGAATNFWEQRMENDGDGNPIYVGYTRKPQTATSSPEWFIVKITYDVNESPTRQQIPDNGVKFEYIWDNRATYFS